MIEVFTSHSGDPKSTLLLSRYSTTLSSKCLSLYQQIGAALRLHQRGTFVQWVVANAETPQRSVFRLSEDCSATNWDNCVAQPTKLQGPLWERVQKGNESEVREEQNKTVSSEPDKTPASRPHSTCFCLHMELQKIKLINIQAWRVESHKLPPLPEKLWAVDSF